MNVNEVLDALKKAQHGSTSDSLEKAWLTSTGLTNYDLQRPAIALYPWGEQITPLRNETPRVISRMGDVAAHWKAITAINTANTPPGLSEGQRGGIITTTVVDKLTTYVGLGLEDYVTYEAEYASEGFDDAAARAVEGLLRSLMISEEKMLLGGNSSILLGTTPTPALATGGTTGGAFADGTYYVGCVALTLDGYSRATVAAGVVQQIVRTNADGTSDTINGGTAQRSALASITLSGGGTAQKINATVTAVTGAVAYAWYVGAASGHAYLTAITTLNSYVFVAAVDTAKQDWASLTAADYSRVGSFGFDGFLYQGPFGSGSGYLATLATGTAGVGTRLTTDGAGGVTEINTAFQSFWDNYRLSPDTIWVGAQQALDINGIVIAGGGAPLFRFNADSNGVITVTGGAVVGSLLNKFTNQSVRIRLHPNMPSGTILFTSRTIPYPMSGVGNVSQVKCRREYYQTQWPPRTRKYEFGVYVDEVLQIYFQPAFGGITNIAPGFAT